MVNKNKCKDCIYFKKWYGQQDKNGKAKVSKYWCIYKQGFIKKFPKKCNGYMHEINQDEDPRINPFYGCK